MTFDPESENIRILLAADSVESSVRADADVVTAGPQSVGPARKSDERTGLAVTRTTAVYHLEARRDAGAIAVATEWTAFSPQHPEENAPITHDSVLIVGRNCFNQEVLKKSGLHRRGIGRPKHLRPRTLKPTYLPREGERRRADSS